MQRVNSKSTTLYKLRKFINTEVALQIFKTFIFPILEYGDFLLKLLACSMKTLDKLQKFQNRMLRLILNPATRISGVELQIQCKMLPLAYRRHLAVLRLMHNLSFNQERLVSIRTTRSSNAYCFKLVLPRTERFRKSVFYSGLREWNALPTIIRMTRNYKLFK